jgi:hypothetical protein
MEQVPVAMNDAVLPETVQTDVVVDLNATGKPELADATRFKVAPGAWVAIFGKVMVWLALVTAKLCETGVAAL